MTVAIHKKNNKSMSEIYEKTNTDINPAYRIEQPEGTGINPIRYGKNFARIQGKCRTCGMAVPEKMETATDGSHCRMGEGKHCRE